jgi:hypothetical protein
VTSLRGVRRSLNRERLSADRRSALAGQRGSRNVPPCPTYDQLLPA